MALLNRCFRPYGVSPDDIEKVRLAGGGTASRDLTIDLQQIKLGDFKKLPESAQRALLGEYVV
ncbi:hypothetical protein [Lysobacter sp. Root559]|uniref:hypothetical protein n=1 Tax=Lysobacter sp. Root559 TaxID=1736559 RepID=UPI00138F0C82|nr:hypothetical protein [Lysobacter sp. Root559]